MTTALNPVQEIINNCTLSGKTICLPAGQLDRDLYDQIADKLQNIGGKWNRKANGFIFKHDPANLLIQLKAGKEVNFAKDYQFYGTPDSLADYLVKESYLREDAKVLEPSAGHGAIIKAIHRAELDVIVDYCEVAPESQQVLDELTSVNFIGEDFLSLDLAGKYDVIIANPPFTKGQDIDHVLKMYESLAPLGNLVSVMSRSWLTSSSKKQTEFRTWLSAQNFEIEYIDAGEFKESGTSVASLFVKIHKRLKPEYLFNDTGATSWIVNDLVLTVESDSKMCGELHRIYEKFGEDENNLRERLGHFVREMKYDYQKKIDSPYIHLMTPEQDEETTQIWINDYQNWKTEQEYV